MSTGTVAITTAAGATYSAYGARPAHALITCANEFDAGDVLGVTVTCDGVETGYTLPDPVAASVTIMKDGTNATDAADLLAGELMAQGSTFCGNREVADTAAPAPTIMLWAAWPITGITLSAVVSPNP